MTIAPRHGDRRERDPTLIGKPNQRCRCTFSDHGSGVRTRLLEGGTTACGRTSSGPNPGSSAKPEDTWARLGLTERLLRCLKLEGSLDF